MYDRIRIVTMKKLQEMTEEEILNHVATAIHDYLMHIRPHGEFILERSIQAQVNELKRFYHWSLGLGVRDRMTKTQYQELEQLIARLRPQMAERARAVQLNYSREQTLWKIRSTSAEAVIAKAFKNAGIKALIESQRYQARVLADLGGYHVRLYVGYKTLEKEDTLDNVIRAVLDLKDAMSRLGKDVRVSRG